MKQSYNKKFIAVVLFFLCIVFLGFDKTENNSQGQTDKKTDLKEKSTVVKEDKSEKTISNEESILSYDEIKKCEGTLFKKNDIYHKKIKILCHGFKQDGRLLPFVKMVNSGLLFDMNCKSCIDFFHTMKKLCVDDGKKKTKINLEREPNLLVIGTTQQIFEEMASDDKMNKDAVKPVITLLYLLRNFDTFTKGEEEYFEHVSLYVERPFKKLIDEYEENLHKQGEERREDINDLF